MHDLLYALTSVGARSLLQLLAPDAPRLLSAPEFQAAFPAAGGPHQEAFARFGLLLVSTEEGRSLLQAAVDARAGYIPPVAPAPLPPAPPAQSPEQAAWEARPEVRNITHTTLSMPWKSAGHYADKCMFPGEPQIYAHRRDKHGRLEFLGKWTSAGSLPSRVAALQRLQKLM